jgi:hypothetical protein
MMERRDFLQLTGGALTATALLVRAARAQRALPKNEYDEDLVFPNGGWNARRALARIEPIWQLLGTRERRGSYFFNGGHNFPADATAKADEWLDRWLKT